MTAPLRRAAIRAVVEQHVDDCVALRVSRVHWVRAPHVRLRHLQRLDERLSANIDGLRTAGEFGATACRGLLANPAAPQVFTVAVQRPPEPEDAQLERLLALVEIEPTARKGLASGLAWSAPFDTTRLTQAWLSGTSDVAKAVAIDVMRLQRRRPPGLHRMIHDRAEVVRQSAVRASLVLGHDDEVAETSVDRAEWPYPDPGSQDAGLRVWLRRAGLAGQPEHVPTLLSAMAQEATTRLAGEAFSMLTGVDLVESGMEIRPSKENLAHSVLLEDPSETDDGLPWPDCTRVRDWWQAEGKAFMPGRRYFAGREPSLNHCLGVLHDGGQRQRAAAAVHLQRLRPSTPLFNVFAPAPLQQLWLSGA